MRISVFRMQTKSGQLPVVILLVLSMLLSLNGYGQKLTEMTIPQGKAAVCVLREQSVTKYQDRIQTGLSLNGYQVFNLKENNYQYIIVDPGTYTLNAMEPISKDVLSTPSDIFGIYPARERKVSLNANEMCLLKIAFRTTTVNGFEYQAPLLDDVSSEDLTHYATKAKRAKPDYELVFDTTRFRKVLVVNQPISEAILMDAQSKIAKANMQMAKANELMEKTKQISRVVNSMNSSDGSVAPSGSTAVKDKYIGVFDATPGSSMGTILVKGVDGRNRVTARLKCTKCDKGFTTIGGMVTKCPYCHGNGFIGH